jgi:hypothetical protein
VSRRYRVAVWVLAVAGVVGLGAAGFLVLAHPAVPSCYLAGQAGVCPIPGRGLVAPLVVGMAGLSCTVLAGVAALLGVSTQLDAARDRPVTARAVAESAERATAQPAET